MRCVCWDNDGTVGSMLPDKQEGADVMTTEQELVGEELMRALEQGDGEALLELRGDAERAAGAA